MRTTVLTQIEPATASDADSCIKAVAVLLSRAPSQLPTAEKLPVAKNPPAVESITPGPIQLRLFGDRAVGYNAPSSIFDVESDSFSGRIYYLLRNLPYEPPEYFAARKHVRMAAIVQGRFKTPGLTMGDCCTGFEFSQKLAYVPARFVVRAALKAAHVIAPALTENLLGQRPTPVRSQQHQRT